jgi:cytochrome c biogenesis protein CcmG/thiol:disulfide interchange protein DsbE
MAERRTRGSRAQLPTDLALRWLTSSIVVACLAIGVLLLGRADQAPVAGYGILDARGVAVTTSIEGVAPGEVAPAFRLPGTDGQAVSLQDLAGQPVVMQFWTSWCLDCVDAIPIFQQLALAHPDTVAVVGIAPGETAGRVDGALDRAGATYTTLLDTNSAVAERYGATSLPFTVVLDAAGHIIAVHEGRVSAAEIEADLAPLLP